MAARDRVHGRSRPTRRRASICPVSRSSSRRRSMRSSAPRRSTSRRWQSTSRGTSSDRQSALRAEARITAKWPVRRRTPVSGLPTQEMVSLVGIAAATTSAVRRVVGVEAHGINACPCAQGLIRGRAAERLAEAGFEDVERILELVPLATHNQRGLGTLLVGTRTAARRERPRGDRRGLDERTRLRAAQAARRALRRRARPPAAALRRGLRSALAEGRAGRALGARRGRLLASHGRSTSRRSTPTMSSRSARAPSAELRGELESGIRRAAPHLARGMASPRLAAAH